MAEPTDLARLAAGIPVAILLPFCLPRIRRTPTAAAAIAGGYAALVTMPLLPETAAWAALLATPALVFLIAKSKSPAKEGTDPNTPRIGDGVAIVLPALALTLGCLFLLDPDATWSALRTTVERNSVSVVASGALACVFLGGPLVGWILSRPAKALDGDPSFESIPSLKHAGTLIGWFERALFFAFLVGGQPQAAAVALAAKSFARFPSLSEHREGFAEYFLIGTLGSLVVALAAAIAVRAALGLSAF